MVATFEESGCRLRYPENWVLTRDDDAEGWTISIDSPETAFFMLYFRNDMPLPDELLGNALEVLRCDYPELESEMCIETVAGQPAIGHDIQFFSFDLTNTCWLRSFCSAQGTLLILCQFNDLESEKNEPVLRAMCASLEVDEE